MNRQEIFNDAYLGLLKQGKPSMSEDDTCMYRAPDGSKCAIGMIITDSEYDPLMDKGGTTSVISLYGRDHLPPRLVNFIQEDRHNNLTFLSKLQTAHDSWSGVFGFTNNEQEFLYNRFAAIALEYDLEMPEVKNVV